MVEPLLHVMWNMEVGGAERAVYQLVREQRRAGLPADVLLGRGGGLYAEYTREAGATVHELGQRRSFDVRRALRARDLFASYRAVHFHSAEPLLMELALRDRRLRCFYTHRGGVRDYGWRKRLRRRVLVRQLRRFHGISGNGRQSALALSQLLQGNPATVQVTYNGLDFDLLAPTRARADVLQELGRPAGGEVLIGTAANLRSWKRVDLLLRAIAQLREPDAHCLVFGEGPARPSLERLANDLGLGGRVTFAGRKEHIGDYLQTLDVFVLPSGPEEGFGNAVVEAMGVGLPPIIFRDGGGLTEHVIDGATGFVVEDVIDLAARLDELIRDRELRLQLGEAARDRVRARYSTAAMLASYETLYSSATPAAG